MGRYRMSMNKETILGQGTSSICRKGFDMLTGQTVAVKSVTGLVQPWHAMFTSSIRCGSALEASAPSRAHVQWHIEVQEGRIANSCPPTQTPHSKDKLLSVCT
eukprot:4038675-Amphidinium_carterae.1